MIGGAIFVSAAESILNNRLLQALAVYAPTVNATDVVNIGASWLLKHLESDVLLGIVDSNMVGLKGAFALGIAIAIAAVVTSFGPRIISIKKTATEKPAITV